MSERPNLILAALLAVAALLAAAIMTALVVTGNCRISGIASFVAVSLSACLLFVGHMHRVSPAWLILVALAALSAMAFLASLVSWLRARRLLGRLPVELVREGALAEIAASAGAGLYVVPARRPTAFCDGLLRPRIVVTSGLLDELSGEEQAAAVWHEAHHAVRREPLKCLLARLATRSFFWLPPLGDLFDRYVLAKELVADRVAVRETGVDALAGALWAAAAAPAGALGLADLASARFERLLNPQSKLPPLFRRRRLITTAIGLAAFFVLLALPATVDLDPAHLRELVTAVFF